jgi:hypothetical protein
MKVSKAVVFLALFALLGGGCGTICNLGGGLVDPEKKPTIYGGVQFDLDVMDRLATKNTQLVDSASQGKSAWGILLLAGFAITEPILSFLGDTVTLPITIPLEEMRTAAEKQEKEERENAHIPEDQIGGPLAINPPAGSATSAVDP